jgi:hypothetical protein
MSKHSHDELPIDLDFSQGDPDDWRNLEDPDSELENDEDEEAPKYVKSMLGFDPAEFDIDDSDDNESDESDLESNDSSPTSLIPDTKLMGTHGPTGFKFDPPYGHCPVCGAKGHTRKEHTDTCENGCTYPSELAVHSVSANTELVENYPGQPRDSHGRFGSGAKGSPAHKEYVAKKGAVPKPIPIPLGSTGAKISDHAPKTPTLGLGSDKIARERKTSIPKGATAYEPNVTITAKSGKGKGVTKAARIGVPGMEVPPLPPIGRLPNLTGKERKIEGEFVNAVNKDPNGMAKKFHEIVLSTTKPGDPPTFGTDDAKVLHAAWSHPELSLADRSTNRAIYNCALHQAANAITKRAFVNHLDTLKKGDEILVTVGGCGCGKGYALKNIPQALELKSKAKAVWDSAGDQNATENPWIQKEAEKRGLKVNYLYVSADPHTQWADPARGVVKRAQDPQDGRMVDAHVFADSYALGARNHHAFHQANKDNPNARFMFLKSGAEVKQIPGVPVEARSLDRRQLAKFAVDTVMNDPTVPAHIKRGATIGNRIWGNPLTENEYGTFTMEDIEPVYNYDLAQWLDEWNEEIQRTNEMGKIANDDGYVIPSTELYPPELNEDGSLVDPNEE